MIIAVLGGGVLGEAVAGSLVSGGYEVVVAEKKEERIGELRKLGLNVTNNNRAAVKEADIVILCVKPKDVESAIKEVSEEIKGKILISMAAAVSIDFLKKLAPEAKIIRTMPNLAVLVREAFIAYTPDLNVTQKELEIALEVLNTLGKACMVDEAQMDVMTAFNGGAPAYMSLIAEAMMYAGLEIGVERDLALTIVAQAMIGTGKLILQGKKTPSEICAMVATPGGVTIEGLFEMESFPIRHAFMKAIKAAVEKARKLSLSFSEH
ncbi:MAG: pyrroline-5-carboxylate reductase [Candidatus Bathyarchaeia archaeon]